MSYTGSCWAVMALLEAVPASQDADAPRPAAPGANTPTWIGAALFGTAAELRTLLDSGVSPASQTEGGTTMLMMAAADADKVRLLIARGVDAKTRAATGADALTIAASYLGYHRHSRHCSTPVSNWKRRPAGACADRRSCSPR